jgi:CheY-like chemotaxis protein
MARLLSRLGHEARYAADGASALAEALAHPPDVVLLDIGLPDMDGYEVAARLMRNRGPKPLFIVTLSGYAGDEERQQASGIDLHLLKPIGSEELNRVLERVGQVSKGLLREV